MAGTAIDTENKNKTANRKIVFFHIVDL